MRKGRGPNGGILEPPPQKASYKKACFVACSCGPFWATSWAVLAVLGLVLAVLGAVLAVLRALRLTVWLCSGGFGWRLLSLLGVLTGRFGALDTPGVSVAGFTAFGRWAFGRFGRAGVACTLGDSFRVGTQVGLAAWIL